MHNPAPIPENDTHKFLWNFDIQTDQLISTRRPDLIIINKKKKENRQNCRLCCPGWQQNKTERMWKERYVPRPCSRIEKLCNRKVTIIPIVIGTFGTVSKGLLKGLEDLQVGGRAKTIQNSTLAIMARILRSVRETWGNLLSLKIQWKAIS